MGIENKEDSSSKRKREPFRAALCASLLFTIITIQTPPTRAIDIEDVSPTTDNFLVEAQHTPSGRVLSLAVSTDGTRLYAGTLSGVWRMDNPEATSPLPRWRQLTRPQPPPGLNPDIPGALEVPNVVDVVVSPADKDIVLAVTTKDTRDKPRDGIYLSEDGGCSWSLVRVGRVGQIVFAPDTPNVVYAAAGSAVAISTDGGRTWPNNIPVTDGPIAGTVWHLAVDFIRGPGLRRVYAAGPNQLWHSTDGGFTWARDTSPVLAALQSGGSFGDFPFEGSGGAASAQILAFDPRNPEQLYLAVQGCAFANGRGYYFPLGSGVTDGQRSTSSLCFGDASLWAGDYSNFSATNSGHWEQVLRPPEYFGGSTVSGRPYLVTKITPKGYLVFFGDKAHVHVAEINQPTPMTKGKPGDASWHRLDGRNASQSKRDNQLFNQLFVHVDPHAIAVSPFFQISLKPASGVDFPYDRNSELDTSQPIVGTIWMANDGGVYRSTDGGRSWQLLPGLPVLPYQPQSRFAGLALAGNPTGGPALYFGVPDNDDFFTLDGGSTWHDDLTEGCGDCPPYFSDPLEPNRILKVARSPVWFMRVNSDPKEYPGLSDPPTKLSIIPRPVEDVSALSKGYNPVILTALTDSRPRSDGDYIIIRSRNVGTRVLLRTTKPTQITSNTDWDTVAMTDGPNTRVFQQGPDLPMNDIDVVQASGGHRRPVFYIGNGTRVWRWTTGMQNWEQIVDGNTLIARRFFVHPYDPKVIYIIAENAIMRSDNGGQSWQVDMSLDRAVTEDGTFSYLGTFFGGNTVGETFVINAMIFDHREMGTRFAVGNAGVFFTLDGTTWERLLSTTALPGHAVAAYFDGISDPLDRALYVAVSGRGILRISPIPSVVNNLVTFVPITSTYKTTSDTTGCPPGFVGKFSFDARLTNKNGSPSISNLVIKVNTLTNGNLLHNAEGGNGGVGSILIVPMKNGYSDGVLSPGEFVDVHFIICLKDEKPFQFFVDVLDDNRRPFVGELKLEAEDYTSIARGNVRVSSRPGFIDFTAFAGSAANPVLEYSCIDFGTQVGVVKQFSALSSSLTGGVFDVRLDRLDGLQIATLTVGPLVGSVEQATSVTPVSGVHNVSIGFTPPAQGLGDVMVDWFKFK